MAWTTPTDRTTGYVVTAADWNVVEDNLTFLYGDTGWTTVSSFTNSWVSHRTVQYSRIGRMVVLLGQVSSGTIGATAFTLPAGYRPIQTMDFAVMSGASGTGAFGWVEITSAGAVAPDAGNTGYVTFDLMFPIV